METKQTAVSWLAKQLETYGNRQTCELNWEDLDSLVDQAKQMEKEQSLIWNKDNPKENGDYICRMDDAFIKLCHYEDGHWFDMWKWDIIVDVKEWMYIPYNK